MYTGIVLSLEYERNRALLSRYYREGKIEAKILTERSVRIDRNLDISYQRFLSQEARRFFSKIKETYNSRV